MPSRRMVCRCVSHAHRLRNAGRGTTYAFHSRATTEPSDRRKGQVGEALASPAWRHVRHRTESARDGCAGSLRSPRHARDWTEISCESCRRYFRVASAAGAGTECARHSRDGPRESTWLGCVKLGPLCWCIAERAGTIPSTCSACPAPQHSDDNPSSCWQQLIPSFSHGLGRLWPHHLGFVKAAVVRWPRWCTVASKSSVSTRTVTSAP